VVHSFEARHGDPERLAQLLRSLGLVAPPLLMDSQAKHVTVAAGSSDLLIRFPPSPDFHDAVWDQAAGSLLIEEAGGRVTDLTGRPLDFASGRRLSRNAGLLASNGVLHPATLEVLRRVS
jgi:3'(2'), 5'-bisphosphate nucleotidase